MCIRDRQNRTCSKLVTEKLDTRLHDTCSRNRYHFFWYRFLEPLSTSVTGIRRLRQISIMEFKLMQDNHWKWETMNTGLVHPAVFVFTFQLSWYSSLVNPRKDVQAEFTWRTSYYLGGLPVRKQLPIPVLSGPVVEQLRWYDQRHYHYTSNCYLAYCDIRIHDFTVWNFPPSSKVVLHVKTQK